ncbi:tryptophan halogenase family protein [uncultured Sneathiella sp.]|uniref:tryptophan halogenase family protein n=1 Tax=uncultured Sneathiella sp. TaxID=879315 RepID=UPI0030EDC72F|tara:strand:- start:67861 stop:69609 length:1749 start_codon:yes stop_codon:yes gene_type:complete
MDNQINEVTIVGGGTAGWLTAAFLVRFMNLRNKQNPVIITLIESPNVPTIGVGEATVPTMPGLLRSLGISEKEFFIRCNASFKLGVRFSNWNHDRQGRGTSFIHPFDGISTQLGGQNPAYHFHKFGGPPGRDNIDDCLAVSGAAIAAKVGPKLLTHGDYESQLNYAYHLDAGKFAEFLREISIGRGVNHVLDDVEEIEQDERGYISALKLQRQGRHPVELVIDCTGFKGVIINQVLGVPFRDYSKYLLNNRAMAVQIPHRDVSKIEPCTNSTALGAGWVWRVPLYNRIGTGYVFSSNFRSDDEARDEFLAHLGDDGKKAEPRVIPVRIGRMERAWEKNCIAIGLSAGFIEPLESTAIYMIENFVKLLLINFPDKSFPPILSQRFNEKTEKMMQSIRDFIILHYCTNNREDSEYWRVAREEMELPESVENLLEEYRHTLPVNTDFDGVYLFNYFSYNTILFSKGYLGGIRYPAERFIVREDWDQRIADFLKYEQKKLAGLPNHYQLLRKIRGEDDAQVPQSGISFGGFGGPAFGAPPGGIQMPQATVQLGGGPMKPSIRFAAKKSEEPAKKAEQDDLSGSHIL